MATRYITSTANSGTGTLRYWLEAGNDGDTIRPDPNIFPKGTLCEIQLSANLSVSKRISINGGLTRIVLSARRGSNGYYLQYGSASNKLGTLFIFNVDFHSFGRYSGDAVAFYVDRLYCYRCSFGGIYADHAVFFYSATTLYDCAFYTLSAYASSYNPIYFGDRPRTECINCTFGANYGHPNSSTLLWIKNDWNAPPGTLTNVVTDKDNEWKTPPPSNVTNYDIVNYYNQVDPRPSSTASWRTGATSTSSTTDIAGLPRKTNGALGAYEYYEQLPVPGNLGTDNITSDGFTLVWSNVENADSYKIIVNGTTTAVQTNQAIITGLTPITTYTVEVISCDSSGDYLDSDAATIDVTTEIGHLETPTGLTSSSITSSSATISWTAVTNATSYQITYTPSGGTSTTVTSSTNSVALTNLSGATSYSVEVVAVGDGTTYTDSSSSSALTFTTLQKLAAPTGLKVTNDAVITTTAKQTITWNTVANATGYKLEYRLPADSTWAWTTKDATETTATFSSRARNKSYDHRVIALGDGTTYEDSDTSSVVTLKTKQQLATPTALTCTNKTETTLTFSWNEVSGTKTYYLRYLLPTASSHSYVYASSSPATITGLTPGTTYNVDIGARVATDSTNYDGSVYTDKIPVTTLTQLSAPTGLTHDQVTSSSARVGWNAVTNAVGYKVEYRVQGATNWTEDQQ